MVLKYHDIYFLEIFNLYIISKSLYYIYKFIFKYFKFETLSMFNETNA